MTPQEIADVIAQTTDSDPLATLWTQSGPVAMGISYSSYDKKPYSLIIKPPIGEAAQTFVEMGGVIVPEKKSIDPFTKMEVVFKSTAVIRAKKPLEAAQLILTICHEFLGYPQNTTFHARPFEI